LLQEIRRLPEVEDVRKGEIGQVEIPPKAIAQSMDLTMDKARKDIYLKEAHLFGKGDPEIKIAILDTGIDGNHQELQHTISKKADFVNLEGLNTSSFIGDTLGYDDMPDDEVGHGTHVAGIIGAKGVRMPEGVAPNCKLIVVRVLATLNQDGKMVGAGLLDNINVGIKWAVDHGADVINMSLGTKQEHGGLPHQEVIQYALDKGVSIIAASGNDGSGDKYYPGALPGVMAISAVDAENNVANFSNYGAHVTMAAPGTNIYSSYINHTYAFSSGTSQAAPFVTGAVALLKSYGLQFGVKLRDNQVKYILKHTSDKLDKQFKNSKSGYGKLNLLDALKLLKYQLNN
jgi:subtilisin family serine protease